MAFLKLPHSENPVFVSGQRIIRREPKVECYVLTKVKSPPFVRSFYDDF